MSRTKDFTPPRLSDLLAIAVVGLLLYWFATADHGPTPGPAPAPVPAPAPDPAPGPAPPADRAAAIAAIRAKLAPAPAKAAGLSDFFGVWADVIEADAGAVITDSRILREANRRAMQTLRLPLLPEVGGDLDDLFLAELGAAPVKFNEPTRVKAAQLCRDLAAGLK